MNYILFELSLFIENKIHFFYLFEASPMNFRMTPDKWLVRVRVMIRVRVRVIIW